MARMIPPSLAPSRKRSAERRFFETLRVGLGHEWTVLHSLETARAEGKKWAEIDFVLIGPEGVFCVEVKGGRVSRADGVWHSTDAAGGDHVVQNPYTQARSGYAEIERIIRRLIQEKVLVGYGVAFPQCRFKEAFESGWPPDMPEEVTADVSDGPRLIPDWIRRLETFARDTPGARDTVRADAEARSKIVEHLRPDFVTEEALGPYFDDIDEALGEAAKLQFLAASGAIRNVERAICRGGPGTGKSVLAMDEARHWEGLARDGLPVVLTCYNHALAEFLREQLAVTAPDVRVLTLHELMRVVVADAGMADRLADEDGLTEGGQAEYFSETLPSLAIEAIEANEANDAEKVHVLIIDEGQDLLREPYVRFIDAVLSGGLSGGRWRLFLDLQQDAYRAFTSAAYERFEVAKDASYELPINCRNADSIAAGVSVLSGDEICLTSTIVPGGLVRWRYFGWEDPMDESKCLVDEIERLTDSGVDLERIALLSPYSFENSHAMKTYQGDIPVVDIGEGERRSGALSFSTIYKFKGLQSDAVILLDITSRLRSTNPTVLRVGASRAKAYLTVLLAEDLRGDIEEAQASHDAACPNHVTRP